MKPDSFNKLIHGADYNCDQWLERPEVIAEDLRLMRVAGMNAMSVGIFSWAKLEPEEGRFDFGWLDSMLDRLYESGVSAILATPSGSKPAWLSRKYPSSCRVGADGQRERHGYRHNHCRTSADYRRLCVDMNTRLAERYGKHPALILWHVSNEYNGMPCYCLDCVAAFRAWLRARYGSLDALNRAWWTDFWSHRFDDWDEIFPADKSIHGLMLDWQRFTSDQTLDFFLAESAPLREITPDVPITTNFMHPDVGLDYWSFAPHVDVISWDSYPEWHRDGNDPAVAARTAFVHDLCRSYKGKPFLLMESTPGAVNWQGVSKPKRPGMHELASMQAIAHGSDSVQYFQWRQSRGGEEKFHDSVIGHSGSADTRIFGAVSRVGEALEKLAPVAGTATKAEVAIAYDFQSGWALDTAQLARSVGKNYQRECMAHHAAFWRRGIPVDVIDGSARDLSGYRVVVMPMLYMLRPGMADRVRTFVASGGTVVATYLSALVDESDLCILGGVPGCLTDVFGLSVEFTDTVVDGERQEIAYRGKRYAVSHYADVIKIREAEALGSYCRGDIAGSAAVAVNRYGSGRSYYIGARVEDSFLDSFYAQLCAESGVAPSVPWRIPEGVGVTKRVGDSGEFVFALNFNDRPVKIRLGSERYENAITGVPVSGALSLPAYGYAALRVSRGR
jgi:beta-galactosidase